MQCKIIYYNYVSEFLWKVTEQLLPIDGLVAGRGCKFSHGKYGGHVTFESCIYSDQDMTLLDIYSVQANVQSTLPSFDL